MFIEMVALMNMRKNKELQNVNRFYLLLKTLNLFIRLLKTVQGYCEGNPWLLDCAAQESRFRKPPKCFPLICPTAAESICGF